MGRPWHIWLLMSSLIFSTPFAVSHWLNSPTLGLVVPFSMCPVMMSSSLRQSSIKKQNFCRSCFLDTIWWVGALAEAILSSTTACVWSYLEIKVKTDFFPLGCFCFFEIVSFMLAMIIQLLLPSTEIMCVCCHQLGLSGAEHWTLGFMNAKIASTLFGVFVCFETESSFVAQSHFGFLNLSLPSLWYQDYRWPPPCLA